MVRLGHYEESATFIIIIYDYGHCEIDRSETHYLLIEKVNFINVVRFGPGDLTSHETKFKSIGPLVFA